MATHTLTRRRVSATGCPPAGATVVTLVLGDRRQIESTIDRLIDVLDRLDHRENLSKISILATVAQTSESRGLRGQNDLPGLHHQYGGADSCPHHSGGADAKGVHTMDSPIEPQFTITAAGRQALEAAQ